jgi:putative ATP-dependent endonuclease of the OLD family
MRIRRLKISNFRGIASGTVDFSGHTLLVGGNNVGKSTVCEALDLILGQDRMSRRPVIDEHDFYCGQYQSPSGDPIEVRLDAILLDLSEEAQRRFRNHLRRWNDKTGTYLDEAGDGLAQADAPGVIWALPVCFIGRYDKDEDDFLGETFFDHPVVASDEIDDENEAKLGNGRTRFSRGHKKLCGFVFLRTLRTGSRALSLQRGSLLDAVLKLSGAGAAEMWRDTLGKLQTLDPAIGDIKQLKNIRKQLRARMAKFVNLAPGEDATAFFASDLTRDHLREVVRLFIAAQPGSHLVPFGRLGTGSVNLLVFALLTFIAELKEKSSVVFAMEEPEIALPPHTQRRVTRYVISEMGQSIVTSHSPYVIEQFDPAQIVILNRDDNGSLHGKPIDAAEIKPKTFRTERRQLAEAILSRAVLVVEGSTESALFQAASTVMERSLKPEQYTHFDHAGVSVFTASGDADVPRYGPIFKALGKVSFGFYDKLNTQMGADALAKLANYNKCWESPEKGIESVLVKQCSQAVMRRFLNVVRSRSDYPSSCGSYDPTASDPNVSALTLNVLKARKGDAYGYAAVFINECQSADDLPATIRAVLEEIQKAVVAIPEDIASPLTGNAA